MDLRTRIVLQQSLAKRSKDHSKKKKGKSYDDLPIVFILLCLRTKLSFYLDKSLMYTCPIT